MIALDTNVLVYAHRGETQFHPEAMTRVMQLCEDPEPWALPLPCVSEFLRVVTHPRVFNPPSDLQDALQFIAMLVTAPSCRLLQPGTRYLDFLFETLASASVTGNRVFDAQIVALCREQGVNVVLTNDRDFENYDGIEVEYLGAVHESRPAYLPRTTVQSVFDSLNGRA